MNRSWRKKITHTWVVLLVATKDLYYCRRPIHDLSGRHTCGMETSADVSRYT